MAGLSGFKEVAAGATATARAAAEGAGAVAGQADESKGGQQTEERLRLLEEENARLRTQVREVADTQQAVMKDAESRGLLAWKAASRG